MGDGEKTLLKLDFDPKVRLAFRGATITSDAGLLACRELDDAWLAGHVGAGTHDHIEADQDKLRQLSVEF
jgi:hypothetical protein